MRVRGIASILHRETIAVLVGAKTFERGEQCFSSQRVIGVEVIEGGLRGTVKPNEPNRRDYACRIWMRDEGVGYECTCPVGVTRQFCKHAVAIALHHLEQERAAARKGMGVLREALNHVTQPELVDGLVSIAMKNDEIADDLKRLALELLARRT